MRLSLLALAVFFVGAGLDHFSNPDFYVAILPAHLPAPLELVYASGVLEILGGVAVSALDVRLPLRLLNAVP